MFDCEEEFPNKLAEKIISIIKLFIIYSNNIVEFLNIFFKSLIIIFINTFLESNTVLDLDLILLFGLDLKLDNP
ncbi:MAG: hypothetical protein N4A54_05555 [Peptostreptococcaceae bacterium]|nr:hypothetical protein [Peptostreptococcaceae bacterium]